MRAAQPDTVAYGLPLNDLGPGNQGRFQSFPVQTDDHCYTGVRYVKRNAQRANLVERAEAWRWSSVWRRTSGSDAAQGLLHR